jgi:hypothetical protein
MRKALVFIWYELYIEMKLQKALQAKNLPKERLKSFPNDVTLSVRGRFSKSMLYPHNQHPVIIRILNLRMIFW